jgi:beta-lactamase class A
MAGKKIFATAAILVLLSASIGSSQDAAPVPKIDRLKRQIERIIRGQDGRVGVAVRHIESGRELAINADMPFPMASTFKVPLLLELLAQAKEGRFSLDDEISVQKSDQHLGSGMLARLSAPGIRLSVRNMAYFMMMISDNSATDILLAKVGADAVNARLKSLGISGMSVNRSCQALISDFLAVERGARTRDELKAAFIKFGENPQDEATPAAMNAILEKVYKKEILDPESCDLMIQIMLKCETGAGRIKGELPPGTIVAHKTGTIAGTVNDCGILYLPESQGHVALTIFTKDFVDDTADVEAIIAKIARLVFDFFLFAD